MTLVAYVVFAALAALFVAAGYRLGLWRFKAQADAEIEVLEQRLAEAVRATRAMVVAREDTARTTVALLAAYAQARPEPPAVDEPAAPKPDSAPRRPAMPTIAHAVLLDGMTGSGKTTVLHRLVTPWLGRDGLTAAPATQRAHRTHRTNPVPVGFEWSAAAASAAPEPTSLHTLQFHDISRESSERLAEHVAGLDAERRAVAEPDRAPTAAIALWVWDMADPTRSRTHLGADRLCSGPPHEASRLLCKRVIVFFNKTDLLPADEAARLIAQETEHIRSIMSSFGDEVAVSFLEGSALDGRGMIDCYGAILTRLELSQLLRPFDG